MEITGSNNGKIPKAPDGGWGWVVVLSSFMHNFLIDSVSFTFGIFYKDILTTFNEGSAKTQLLNSVVVGTSLLIGPLTGALINRSDCRRVAMAGGVVCLFGLFLSTFSPNLDVMILLYGVVGGIGCGLIYTPSLVIVSNYFDKRRALAIGIATCGSGIGSFVCSPLYEFLVENFGWKGAMWIVSAIVFNSVLFGVLYRPLKTQDRKLRSARDTGASYEDNTTFVRKKSMAKLKSSIGAVVISFFTNTAFLLLLLSGFLNTLGVQIPYNLLPISAQEKGLSGSDGALLISILGITNTLSMILSGLVVDYPWADSILLYSFTLLIGGVASYFLPYCSSLSSLALYCVAIGVAIGTTMSLPTIILLEFITLKQLPIAFGLFNFFTGLSTIIGPPIAGILVDMTGSYNAAFYFAGTTFVLSGMACIPVKLIIKYKPRSGLHQTTEIVEMTHM